MGMHPGERRGAKGTDLGGQFVGPKSIARFLVKLLKPEHEHKPGESEPDMRRTMGRLTTAGGSVVSVRLHDRKPRPDDRIVDTRDPRRLGTVATVDHSAGTMRVHWDDGSHEVRPQESVTPPLREPLRSFDAHPLSTSPAVRKMTAPAAPSTPKEKLRQHLADEVAAGRVDSRQAAAAMRDVGTAQSHVDRLQAPTVGDGPEPPPFLAQMSDRAIHDDATRGRMSRSAAAAELRARADRADRTAAGFRMGGGDGTVSPEFATSAREKDREARRLRAAADEIHPASAAQSHVDALQAVGSGDMRDPTRAQFIADRPAADARAADARKLATEQRAADAKGMSLEEWRASRAPKKTAPKAAARAATPGSERTDSERFGGIGKKALPPSKSASPRAEAVATDPSLTDGEKRTRLKAIGMTPGQVDALVPPAAKASPAAAKMARGKAATAPSVTAEELSAMSTREQGHAAVASMGKTELVTMARELNIPRPTTLKAADLRREIVDATIGRKVDSVATRGFSGDLHSPDAPHPDGLDTMQPHSPSTPGPSHSPAVANVGGPGAAFDRRAKVASSGARALDQTHHDFRGPAAMALEDYQADSASRANDVLREHGGDLGRLRPEDRKVVRDLDEAIARAQPTKRDIVVYRGVDSRTFGGQDSVPGFEFTDHGFVATSARDSADERFSSGGVEMRILVPRGTVAISNQDLLDDDEVLLGRGHGFRVVADRGSNGGVRRLDVELVPAGEAHAVTPAAPKASPAVAKVARAKAAPAKARPLSEVASSVRHMSSEQAILAELASVKASDLPALARGELNVQLPPSARTAAQRRLHIAQTLVADSRRRTGGI